MEAPFLPPVSAGLFWCLVFAVCPNRACFGSVAYLRWAWMPWLRLLGRSYHGHQHNVGQRRLAQHHHVVADKAGAVRDHKLLAASNTRPRP